MFAINFVNKLRDKVVAAYRLRKVNLLLEETQWKKSELAEAEKLSENLAARLNELSTDGWSVPVDRIHEGKTTEEIKTEVKEELTKSKEETDKRIEALKGKLAELGEETNKAIKGEKPYRMNREAVTDAVNQLIDAQTANLNLEDLAKTDDNN